MDRVVSEVSADDPDADKPQAAICHGPCSTPESGVSRGLRMTGWPSLKPDLVNSGAEWGVVTSRDPGDLPAFDRRVLESFEDADLRGAFP